MVLLLSLANVELACSVAKHRDRHNTTGRILQLTTLVIMPSHNKHCLSW